MPKSFLEELTWRGMIHDMTPGLDARLQAGPICGYIGFDPTAVSLTLGNYVQIMLLTHFQRCGHRPVVLMGGATGRIGDPSGKDAERELKSFTELDSNLARQVAQMKRLLDFEDPDRGAILVNNLDFYAEMNVLDFLRDVGKHFTINYMMAKESVRRRVETGMSYTEFSYQLLQACDYLRLHETYGVALQMGGSDQWGNITSGTEFIRRTLGHAEVFALTSPLLTKADGKKFGKSEEGNIWLDPAMTSPYAFYQFWLNVDDRDLPSLFRYFSLREKEEVESLEAEYADNPRALKAMLAEELTIRLHGQDAFESTFAVTQLLFSPTAGYAQLESLQPDDFELMALEIPSTTLALSRLDAPVNVVDLLAEGGLLPSKSEVRRAIQQHAVSVNLRKISDIQATLSREQLLHGHYLLVEQGRKNKRILKFM